MTTSGFQVKVDDLKDLSRDLGKVDARLRKAIPKGLRVFTVELRRRTETRGRSLGGVHRHAVKGGVKQFAKADRAGVKLMASKSPAILGAEYGSKQWAQFPRWRGNQFSDQPGSTVGYMLHPAMRDYLPTAEEQLADVILEAIADEIEATI